MVGENFGEFGESGAIRQSFIHSNLHLKIVEIRLIDYREKFTESKTSVYSYVST